MTADDADSVDECHSMLFFQTIRKIFARRNFFVLLQSVCGIETYAKEMDRKMEDKKMSSVDADEHR